MDESSVYDLMDRKAWQELLDDTHATVGMPTALLDPRNVILQSSGERNEPCREIRDRKETLPVICGQSQRFMAKMARSQQAHVVEICEAGMAKLVMPLFRDRRFWGSITTCGCKVPVGQKALFVNLADHLFHRLNPS
jgi:hypothetical protein